MYLSIIRPDLNYLKFNVAASFIQKQEDSYWVNGFCPRKGGGYFNTAKTENIATQKQDKNFINTSQVTTAEFNKGQCLQ